VRAARACQAEASDELCEDLRCAALHTRALAHECNKASVNAKTTHVPCDGANSQVGCLSCVSLHGAARYMHYSFWRWTSVLLELEFEDPMDTAGAAKLRVFRLYSKFLMLLAAVLYFNSVVVHSSQFSTVATHEHAAPSPAPTVAPTWLWAEAPATP